jgi:hypothetical protein
MVKIHKSKTVNLIPSLPSLMKIHYRECAAKVLLRNPYKYEGDLTLTERCKFAAQSHSTKQYFPLTNLNHRRNNSNAFSNHSQVSNIRYYFRYMKYFCQCIYTSLG